MCNIKIICIILLMSCASVAWAENPLIGKWQSNKEETIKLISSSTELSDKAKDTLIKEVEFGKLILEITDTQIITYFDGEKGASEYAIVEVEKETVKIKGYNKLLERDVITTIKVNEKTMLVQSDLSPAIVEVFSKIE